MKIEQCQGCEHLILPQEYCAHHMRYINKIRGCSFSKSGRMFTGAGRTKEAISLKIAKNKGKQWV